MQPQSSNTNAYLKIRNDILHKCAIAGEVSPRLRSHADRGRQVAIIEILPLRHVAEHEREVPVVESPHPSVREVKTRLGLGMKKSRSRGLVMLEHNGRRVYSTDFTGVRSRGGS